MGIGYLGPVDGHNIAKLEILLDEAKNSGQCTLIHVRTTKGKGYAPAEVDPNKYHGLTAENAKSKVKTFSTRAGEILLDMAQADERMCVITAAMADGCGLCPIKKALPSRFFDVGIAEGHALTFAAGLAAAGMRPVFAVYSTFMQRGYDNIIHDIALQNLPVTVCIDRAGINMADGPTHHGIFDVAMLLHIPNVTLFSPLDFAGLERALSESLALDSPAFVRYQSGGEIMGLAEQFTYVANNPFIRVSSDFGANTAECVIITYGRITSEAIRAAELLRKQGKECRVIVLEKLKPYDTAAKTIATSLGEATHVAFLEEGISAGGAGACLMEQLRKHGALDGRSWQVFAIEDHFAFPEADKTMFAMCNIAAEDVLNWINKAD
jgi:1-deoxy-D-xylulose-5-phosphate synthase